MCNFRQKRLLLKKKKKKSLFCAECEYVRLDSSWGLYCCPPPALCSLTAQIHMQISISIYNILICPVVEPTLFQLLSLFRHES